MRSYLPKNQPELKLISLEDVAVEPVRWLWYPYIPLGKLSIIHGDPAEGKTTLALWIAAACSRGLALPGGETGGTPYRPVPDCRGRFGGTPSSPGCWNPRRTCTTSTPLTRRISLSPCWMSASGEAIRDTQAQLMILDPLQAYLGEKVDMNRANEVRTVMKGLTKLPTKPAAPSSWWGT